MRKQRLCRSCKRPYLFDGFLNCGPCTFNKYKNKPLKKVASPAILKHSKIEVTEAEYAK